MHSHITTDGHTLTFIYVCISKISSRKRFCEIQSVSDRIFCPVSPTVQHLIQRYSTYFLNLMIDIFFSTQNIPSKPFLGHISLSGPTSAPPPSLLRSTFSVFLSSHFWINFRCARGQALLSSNHLQALQFVTVFSSITPSFTLYQQLCLDFYYSL